jgi:8-oxo-dGTP pyrophosphatase MutT (NUDIX family)
VERGRIRPVALCVIRRGDDLLVFEGEDRVKGEVFYRPLGGGIEFGETGAEAAARELAEEIGAAVVGLAYLGTLESIFVHEGRPGHEIAMIYETAFADPGFYDREAIDIAEGDRVENTAIWRPLSAFRAGRLRLYPEGLLDLLAGPGTAPGR